MRVISSLSLASVASLLAVACSTSTGGRPPAADAGSDAAVTATPGVPATKIAHVVIVIQENHTFDAYFGRYCTAPTGSSPTCNDGPGCCEAGPATEPSGSAPVVLDDAANGAWDPDHGQECELAEIGGGKMDGFVTNKACGSPKNFAYADPSVVAPYRALAQGGALADRYFQPVAGASASNDMYFARARFVFQDNDATPKGVAATCSFGASPTEFSDPTIGDLLNGVRVTWAYYAEGYAAAVAAKPGCAPAPADCPFSVDNYPCIYDPSDDPFAYYASSRDVPDHTKDFADLAKDIAAGALPSVAFVKAIGFRTEHPGVSVGISAGVKFATDVVAAISASKYADDTLLLVTYDEGGGFFDHVAPPPDSAVDHKPYGTRVPLLAVGKFAKKNFVSHATLEHSSIVRFIEWNWLGAKTGQLEGRDAAVSNLGSVLDPAATGQRVPED